MTTSHSSSIQIHVLPNFIFSVNKANSNIPHNSVIRELMCFKDSTSTRHHPTVIAINTDSGLTADETAWLDASESLQRTASITHDGLTLWIDVSPKKNGSEYGLIVYHKTIDQCYNIWETQIPVLRIELAALSESVADDQANSADYIAWKETTTTLDRLLGSILATRRIALDSVSAKFAGALGSGPPGLAEELISNWQRFFNNPLNPLLALHRYTLLAPIQVREAQAGIAICRSNVDPFNPLNHVQGIGRWIGAIHSLTLTSIRVLNSINEAATLRRADPTTTNEYIVNQLEQFQRATRSAATHQTVYGSLIESLLSEIIRRVVSPLSVHSGAVAEFTSEHQLDVIIWDHHILPSVIEHGQVAVVPVRCICGILEIKANADDIAAIASRLQSYADAIDFVRGSVDLVGLTDMATVAVPKLAVLVSSTSTHDEVRYRTGGVATSLVWIQDKETRIVNPAGVQDLLDFLYNRVLPTHRRMRQAILTHDANQLR